MNLYVQELGVQKDQVSPIRMQPATYDVIEVNLSAMVEILHCTDGKRHSVQGSTQLKIYIKSKKALNKSCSKLNFVHKSPGAHMSISSQCGASGLERQIQLKYYFVLKRKNTFKLGLNADKNNDN